ncbi:hypothetical protein ACFVU2_15220 [Leifsonia sp. NPDC058194]|uniref:hypothetical protein n=1 Tax=Leifsonia sp. NPDC058194 TaxID=3346374 RepID=UPI0036D8DD42
MFILGTSVPFALPHLVGPERFAVYVDDSERSEASAWRLYCWNIEASAAVLGAYAALEVGVRNAMHTQLGAMHGRPDWWHAAGLRSNERTHLEEVTVHLDRRKGAGGWGTGHVVAELRSAFWEGLLVNRYHASLWERGLRRAFPHFDGRRGELRARLERLRLLRNRAAHHEPIYARDLQVDHRVMCEIAGYVDPGLRVWIASHSRLPRVVESRARTLAGHRPTRF